MEGWVDAWIALSLEENLTVPSYFARADFKVSLEGDELGTVLPAH